MKVLTLFTISILLIVGTSCSKQKITYYSYNGDTITKVVGSTATRLYYGKITRKDLGNIHIDSNAYLNVKYIEGEFWGWLIFRNKGKIEYLNGFGTFRQQDDSLCNEALYHLFTNNKVEYYLYTNMLDSIKNSQLEGIYITNVNESEEKENKKDYPRSKIKVTIEK